MSQNFLSTHKSKKSIFILKFSHSESIKTYGITSSIEFLKDVMKLVVYKCTLLVREECALG